MFPSAQMHGETLTAFCDRRFPQLAEMKIVRAEVQRMDLVGIDLQLCGLRVVQVEVQAGQRSASDDLLPLSRHLPGQSHPFHVPESVAHWDHHHLFSPLIFGSYLIFSALQREHSQNSDIRHLPHCLYHLQRQQLQLSSPPSSSDPPPPASALPLL